MRLTREERDVVLAAITGVSPLVDDDGERACVDAVVWLQGSQVWRLGHSDWHSWLADALIGGGLLNPPTAQDSDICEPPYGFRSADSYDIKIGCLSWYFPKSLLLWGCEEHRRRNPA